MPVKSETTELFQKSFTFLFVLVGGVCSPPHLIRLTLASVAPPSLSLLCAGEGSNLWGSGP